MGFMESSQNLRDSLSSFPPDLQGRLSSVASEHSIDATQSANVLAAQPPPSENQEPSPKETCLEFVKNENNVSYFFITQRPLILACRV